jgi:malonyl-CoA decarboxylase
VARFHLGNGARLERINWLADTSARGIKQSAGMMVNYLYRPDDIEDNHEAYAREGRVVMSDTVKRLLRKPA